MRTENLREVIHAAPFRPFALCLADGTRVDVPHPDFIAAREFTHASAAHEALWREVATPGELTMRSQLDLWQMLIPATQPFSKLDYTPEPETVTVVTAPDRTEFRPKVPLLKLLTISSPVPEESTPPFTAVAPLPRMAEAVAPLLPPPVSVTVGWNT